ncbi:hypothetical protein [Cohnella silvisoli]|uniref:GH16 domain-containing protein n=1 Tax=Cohnella silvisoli TaxID=2873699 RepID=A0ABV1KL07_9BACL|nr:hypothetical protein [Cohnella silvisoli]
MRLVNVRSVLVSALIFVLLLTMFPIRPAQAAGPSISVDASKVQGIIDPKVTGGMFEWANNEMNGVWAERVLNRSFENESVYARRSPLYDDFDLATVDASRWTPVLLAGTGSGTAAVSNSKLTLSGAGATARFGMLSNDIPNTARKSTTIETKVTAISGTNALLSIYGGTGAGDFSHFVEYGIEGGVLKVFTSSGVGNWTGGAVSAPGTLSVQVTPYYTGGRKFRFYWNGNLVYSLTDIKDVHAPDFRLFLYGYGSSVTKWDYVRADPAFQRTVRSAFRRFGRRMADGTARRLVLGIVQFQQQQSDDQRGGGKPLRGDVSNP